MLEDILGFLFSWGTLQLKVCLNTYNCILFDQLKLFCLASPAENLAQHFFNTLFSPKPQQQQQQQFTYYQQQPQLSPQLFPTGNQPPPQQTPPPQFRVPPLPQQIITIILQYGPVKECVVVERTSDPKVWAPFYFCFGIFYTHFYNCKWIFTENHQLIISHKS